jgi:hypothetical protein
VTDVTDATDVIDVSHLLDVFDGSTVHRLTTDKVIRRGEQYRKAGAVTITALTTTSVSADVRGTKRYEVRFDASGHPDWSCTCPAAVEGDFCKHCVALAAELAAIDSGESVPPLAVDAQPARTASPRSGASVAEKQRRERERLIDFLSQLPTSRLVDLLVAQADTDWKLHEQLLLEADQGSAEPVDLDKWMRRIDEAMFVDDYVDWRAANSWASDVHFVLDALSDLIDNDHAGAAIPLAEHAFRTVERVVGYVDDSDSGCLRDISERIGEVHLRACQVEPPDQVALARSLIELEVNSELEGLYHAVNVYADLLGDVGLAEYGRLLDTLAGRGNHADRGYAVKSMRRAYVTALNDVDALVAELSKDPGPHDVVTIMNTLSNVGRVDEAIDAGRAGLARFGAQRFSTAGVIDALAALLRQRGDVSGSIRLYQDAFDDNPSLSTLQRLLDAVDHDRKRWLDVAIEAVRQRVSTPKAGQSRVHNDVLVEILMWAQRHDDAWDAAHAGGCNPRRWMDLAATREATHPLDAIDVYEPQVIRSIEAKNNKAYTAAIALMTRIRRLADSAGVPERFDALVAIARTAHKPKRNLQKLLDQQGW